MCYYRILSVKIATKATSLLADYFYQDKEVLVKSSTVLSVSPKSLSFYIDQPPKQGTKNRRGGGGGGSKQGTKNRRGGAGGGKSCPEPLRGMRTR